MNACSFVFVRGRRGGARGDAWGGARGSIARRARDPRRCARDGGKMRAWRRDGWRGRRGEGVRMRIDERLTRNRACVD
jgi:hypothetical protein